MSNPHTEARICLHCIKWSVTLHTTPEERLSTERHLEDNTQHKKASKSQALLWCLY